jgi:hypothetical protein
MPLEELGLPRAGDVPEVEEETEALDGLEVLKSRIACAQNEEELIEVVGNAGGVLSGGGDLFTPEIIKDFIARIRAGEESTLLTSACGLRSKVEEIIEAEKQLTSDVSSADSVEVLCDILQNSPLVQNDESHLPHKTITVDITRVFGFDLQTESGLIRAAILTITRSFGIRQKVIELLKQATP